MTDSGNKPGHFNIREPNAAVLWQVWKEELEFYTDALGVEEGDNRRRIAMLMSLAGPETRQVYAQLEFASAAEAKQYKKVIEKLEEYVRPRRSLIYDKRLFITRVQEEGESFDTFVTAVRTLAALCELGETKDAWIATVLVVGLRDRNLKEKLLKELNLTVAKVIEWGRVAEVAAIQMKTLHPMDNAVVAKVDAKARGNWRASGAQRQDGGRGRASSSRGVAQDQDYDCRDAGRSISLANAQHTIFNADAARNMVTTQSYARPG